MERDKDSKYGNASKQLLSEFEIHEPLFLTRKHKVKFLNFILLIN